MSGMDDVVLREAQIYGDEMHIDLWYPDVPDTLVRKFVIGLMDVRCADSIRVSYDKERDGWKIEQASTFTWDGDDEECDPDWQEVAFVQAWGRYDEDSPKTAQNAAQGTNGGRNDHEGV